MAQEITLRYRPPGPVSAKFSVWGGGANSTALVRAIMGPIGSGKSTACIFEILGRALRQRPGKETGRKRSRWAVIRNTYPELKTTTIKSWHQWVPPTFGRWQGEGPPTHFVEIQTASGIVELEVLFLALDKPDDIRKLLSLELTGAWVNEAREVPRSVLSNLSGRVGRFPPMSDGGPTWSGIIMDTNPPDTDGWFYQLFEVERPAGFELYRQPGGRSPHAENVQNLIPGYYDRSALGQRLEWIRVYIDAEYGVVMDGKPVFPDYRDLVHCRPVLVTPGLPIYIGIDFGLTPAAVLGQRTALGQWRIFKELVSSSMGIKRFSEQLLGPKIGRLDGHEFVITGDPAGDQRAQTDERTPFDILRACGIPGRRAPTNDVSLRLEPIEGALTRTIDGQPGLLLDPVGCPMLRKALAGGYRYRRIQTSGERFDDKPEKNEFSHVADACQYMFLGAGEGAALLGRQRGQRSAGSSYAGHMAR